MKFERSVIVAITGALSIPRKKAIEMIRATPGAHYSCRVTSHTDYLVSKRNDTIKARNARVLGTVVISEEQFLTNIHDGRFPPSGLPHPKLSFPEIIWEEEAQTPEWCMLHYRDAGGEESKRTILATSAGVSTSGHQYLGAYDDGVFKTFRVDRILEMAPVEGGEPQ